MTSRTHCNNRDDITVLCDKSFTWARDLKKPTIVHTGQREFLCQVHVSNKVFTRASMAFLFQVRDKPFTVPSDAYGNTYRVEAISVSSCSKSSIYVVP